MANFPTSPSVGDQFTTDKVSYRWNGAAWDLLEGVKQGTITEYPPSNTKLLLHGETITDSSASQHSLTVGGDAAVSTVQNKFGNKSLIFDGTGDYLEMPISTDFAFGTGDFTIEFWSWKSANGSGGYDVALSTSAQAAANMGGWFLEWSNSRGFWFYDSVANTSIVAYNTTANDSTWHHIAVVKSSGVVKVYIDGEEKASASYSASIAAAHPLRVGATGNGQSAYNGYVDELRISKGVARYTANFTPPTVAYTDPVRLPIGSLTLTEGSEPSATADASTIYATSSGTFVKNSSGTVTALTANAAMTEVSKIELDTVTSQPATIASTGQLVHWDRSAEADTNIVLLLNGETLTDSSSSGHTLTLVSDPVSSTTQSKFGGKSIHFDSNDYIEINSHADFEFGSGDFTMEAWLYVEAWPAVSTGEIFNRSITDSADAGGSIHFNVNVAFGNKLNFNFYHLNNSMFTCTDPTALSLNTWYHAAAVRYGNVMTLYKNGVAVATDSYSGAFPALAGKARIGRRSYTSGYGYWNGAFIDDLRITKGVARYTGSFTPPTSALTSTHPSGLHYIDSNGTATLIKADS